MTRQTATPIEQSPLNSSARSAREIARVFFEVDEGTGAPLGDLNPSYQRDPVWTDDQRVGLVRSWLMGIPIPAVIINDRIFGPWPDGGPNGTPEGGYGYAVIDGKQRIETAIAWFFGDLAVPASWFSAEEVETTIDTEDGPYVTYSGLSKSEQRYCANRFSLPTAEGRFTTIEEEASIYLLTNGGGTPQTDDNMANAARVAQKA